MSKVKHLPWESTKAIIKEVAVEEQGCTPPPGIREVAAITI